MWLEEHLRVEQRNWVHLLVIQEREDPEHALGSRRDIASFLHELNRDFVRVKFRVVMRSEGKAHHPFINIRVVNESVWNLNTLL